jgi:hypothetical protein
MGFCILAESFVENSAACQNSFNLFWAGNLNFLKKNRRKLLFENKEGAGQL